MIVDLAKYRIEKAHNDLQASKIMLERKHYLLQMTLGSSITHLSNSILDYMEAKTSIGFYPSVHSIQEWLY